MSSRQWHTPTLNIHCSALNGQNESGPFSPAPATLSLTSFYSSQKYCLQPEILTIRVIANMARIVYKFWPKFFGQKLHQGPEKSKFLHLVLNDPNPGLFSTASVLLLFIEFLQKKIYF